MSMRSQLTFKFMISVTIVRVMKISFQITDMRNNLITVNRTNQFANTTFFKFARIYRRYISICDVTFAVN